MALQKLFIANRGEIAVRIIRAARDLGIATVQAVSSADRDMQAARLADAVVEVGPAHAGKSYLNQEAMLRGAIESGCDAVHPGYGFLSENAGFAEAVERAGLVFVGPAAETIRLMGDKARAREVAAEAGVPTVPGTVGGSRTIEALVSAADEIGFPLMIKAAAGGGGRGIRIAEDAGALAGLLIEAQTEARAAFGDDTVYLERFLPRARHVEVQVLGDGERVVHLFERECSLQRRRQKLWEEAPAACLTAATRASLCACAVRLAERVGYSGAGTLEFLLDEGSGEFFFIEMNTRIQVEHPITEMITGVDLVREMLCIAGGSKLPFVQDDIRMRGHSIECRINAEDPALNFRPSPGVVRGCSVPGGPGVRFDTLLYPGYVMPPFYDSLLSKLIVWDETRERALSRLRGALRELEVDGISTTIGLHRRLAEHPDVVRHAVHTGWLEAWLAETPFYRHGDRSRMKTRMSFGGDEHIFVELDEAMSLDACFRALSLAKAVRASGIRGITEVCPANASFQVKFDPDVIAPQALWNELEALEQATEHAEAVLETRIIEVPVLYNDPWTHETLMRFRSRHQAPELTDLEYAAKINGYGSVDALIAAHAASPWFVSMVGFVAGLPWLYQMVERDKQIEVPKYLRPRTDTPRLTVGHGGCLGCIYSVRGAGGYQMFGITPMPIYDPQQSVSHLRDFMILFNPGDIVKFRPIDRAEYDAMVDEVETGRFQPRIRPATFSLDAFHADSAASGAKLVEALHAD